MYFLCKICVPGIGQLFNGKPQGNYLRSGDRVPLLDDTCQITKSLGLSWSSVCPLFAICLETL